MRRPALLPPIGVRLARTARVAGQAFERALAEAGGSTPTWQVLLLVRSRQWGTQSQLAAAIGIGGPTLTHHLSALEQQGLVRRWREADNRRVQRVELTEDGEALFRRLQRVAARFDEQLRTHLGADGVGQLAELLERLDAGLGADASAPGERGPTRARGFGGGER